MKPLIIIGLILFGMNAARAQDTEYRSRFEFGAIFGYQFGGAMDNTEKVEGVDVSGTSLGLPGSGQWGIIANMRLAPTLMLEVSYDRQDTRLDLHNPEDNSVTEVSDLRVEVLQAGLMYVWSSTSTQLFTGGKIGFTNLNPRGDFENERRVSVGVLFGGKLFVSKYFGFRADTRLLVTTMPKNDMLFCNPQGECYDHQISSFMTEISLNLGVFVAI